MAAITACALVLVSCASGARSDPSESSKPASTGRADTSREPSLRAVDGGLDFYARFRNGLPSSPDFFPIGVWSESVVDDTGWPKDQAAGINVYVAPTPDTDADIIRRAGMYAIPYSPGVRGTVNGVTTSDEVDMWGGPGAADWTGKFPGEGEICVPAAAKCGYTVMNELTSALPEGLMAYTNFGKGVVFWATDEQAKKFVNGYQDVVSASTYWFTDPNICGPGEAGALLGFNAIVSQEQCRQAANYGRTVARVRSIIEPAGSKPVWTFVEVGIPAPGGTLAITGPQIRAAVWSGLINGARGVVYFNHSFGGDCASQHVLRDCDPAVTATVTDVNAQIDRLAPVLNAPFVDNLVTTDGDVQVAAKLAGDDLYVLAGSTGSAPGTVRLSLSCGSVDTAVVVDEQRELPITDRAFTDRFADGESVHIYRIRGGGSCELT
jgi:hypothetical protein